MAEIVNWLADEQGRPLTFAVRGVGVHSLDTQTTLQVQHASRLDGSGDTEAIQFSMGAETARQLALMLLRSADAIQGKGGPAKH